MKKLFIYLFAATVLFPFFNCSGSGSSDKKGDTSDEKIEAQGYYLQKGKIYFYDFAKKEASLLVSADKDILTFWPSPNGEYIAFERISDDDNECDAFASLGVFDISKKEIVEEFGADLKQTAVIFQGWQSDNKLFYTVHPSSGEEDAEPAEPISFAYTVGGENERLDEVVGDMGDGPEVKSLNDNYSTTNDEDGVHLVEKATGTEKILTVEKGDIRYYTVNVWLSPDTFLFTASHQYQAQCDIPADDVYLYNLKTGESKLILENASQIQLIK